jgi:hypothetical protein
MPTLAAAGRTPPGLLQLLIDRLLRESRHQVTKHRAPKIPYAGFELLQSGHVTNLRRLRSQ